MIHEIVEVIKRHLKKPSLKKRVIALEERVRLLEDEAAKKKTISQTTTAADTESPTVSQIINEWLNGEENGNGQV